MRSRAERGRSCAMSASRKRNVIRRMFREIDAKCYIMTDGDDTYPADEAKKLCEAVLERGADMVVGDRLSSSYFEGK